MTCRSGDDTASQRSPHIQTAAICKLAFYNLYSDDAIVWQVVPFCRTAFLDSHFGKLTSNPQFDERGCIASAFGTRCSRLTESRPIGRGYPHF
jgi:hypothetical protein